MAADSTLLAYLVPRLTHSTENTAIEALGYILSQSEAARDALDEVLRSLGSEIDPIARVATEVSDEKRGRPDLAGFDEHGRERLLIEVKFWAGLQPGQPNGYLARLKRNNPAGPSALLVVAPAARSETLWPEVRRRAASGFELSEAPDLKSAVVCGERRLMLTSWRVLLGRMEARASEAGESAVELDIRQLRGLTTRMDREAFLPLRSEELAPEIPRRLARLPGLVDDATDRGREAGWLTRVSVRTPWRYGYRRRFTLFGARAWFQVDFVSWARRGETPLWLRFPKSGPKDQVDRPAIRRALGLSSDQNYYPIHLPTGVEYDAVLDDVVDQLERIGRTINPRYEIPQAPGGPGNAQPETS